MEIRPARPADADGVWAVSARSLRAAYADLVEDPSLIETAEDPEFPEQVRDWLETVRSDGGVDYLVAAAEDPLAKPLPGTDRRVADPILGFAQFMLAPEYAPDDLDADDAYLKSLYVDPERWHEGIGTDLLATGIDRIDASAVVLDVLRGNDQAIGFYEARGFERAGESSVDLAGATYDTYRYVRDL